MIHPSEIRLSVCNGCCCGHVEIRIAEERRLARLGTGREAPGMGAHSAISHQLGESAAFTRARRARYSAAELMKGNPRIDEESIRQAARQAGLEEGALSFPYCLGPCSYANVARVDAGSQSWIFARINDEKLRAEVMEFAKAPSDGNLGPNLRARLLKDE